MYYISYFSNINNIPKSAEVVGIVDAMPRWVDGREYRSIAELAPTSMLSRLWKSKRITWDAYITMYHRDVLSKLDIHEVIKKLGDGDVCLCSYEANGEHSHRYLIKKWFELYGIEVKEVSDVGGE